MPAWWQPQVRMDRRRDETVEQWVARVGKTVEKLSKRVDELEEKLNQRKGT